MHRTAIENLLVLAGTGNDANLLADCETCLDYADQLDAAATKAAIEFAGSDVISDAAYRLALSSIAVEGVEDVPLYVVKAWLRCVRSQ